MHAVHIYQTPIGCITHRKENYDKMSESEKLPTTPQAKFVFVVLTTLACKACKAVLICAQNRAEQSLLVEAKS